MRSLSKNEVPNSEKLLEQILRVVAAAAVHGKTLSEGAPFLQRLGVDHSVIAAIYDTSGGSVRAILSQAKKSARKPKAKRTSKRGATT